MRTVGRILLVVLGVVLLASVQQATVLGVIALGAAPDVAVWASFLVTAVLALGLAAAREAVRARRRRRPGATGQRRAVPSSRPRMLLVAGAFWAAASLVSLTTFLRLDLAPMASPAGGGADAGGGAAPHVDVRTTGAAAASVTPLVVVHGGPGVPLSPAEEAAVEQLAGDRPVVVYDQAGAGRSGALDDPRDHTLRHAVDELAEVAAATGAGEVDLLGYSWGAAVATAFAVEHPDRVGRMVLISPGAIPWRGETADPVGPQSRLGPAELAGLYLRALAPRNLFLYAVTAADPVATRWFASDAELDARFLDLYESTAAGLHCDASQVREPPEHVGYFANQVPQLHPDLTGLAEADAATADLRMLVLRGACDYIPEAVADEYVAEFGAELVPVPGAGHALLEDQPDVVLEEIERFLTTP